MPPPLPVGDFQPPVAPRHGPVAPVPPEPPGTLPQGRILLSCLPCPLPAIDPVP